MSTTNYTTTDETSQPSILTVPWVVAPKIIVISGDATPQYNAAAQVDENHMLLKANHRNLDGKFGPKEKPVTRKQATRKLASSSKRLDSAIDKMMAMESW